MIPALAAYYALLGTKVETAPRSGFDRIPELAGSLFPHQRATVEFLLGIGRGAGFLDTGMGKTRIFLEWARVVAEATNRPVLVLAPLAVGEQHVDEARALGHDDVRVVRHQDQVRRGVNIANYEMLKAFDRREFAALVLDESSIIKSFTGATTRALTEFGAGVPWRLAMTATPAPNDHMELGQHAAFLGVMRANEMLSRFFIADQSEMGRYRLKKPAVERFWNWMATWSRCLSKPSDLGFSDEGFDMPPLDLQRHVVRVDQRIDAGVEGDQMLLLRAPKMSATGIHAEKRLTVDQRAEHLAGLVDDEPNEAWALWVDTDYEADAITRRIRDAVEVRGNMSPDEKTARLRAFARGEARVMVTKPRIAGFGCNWQHCARVGFVGLSYSYEQFYQAVRRCWRFRQQRAVKTHVVMAETELGQWRVITRKQADHETMKREMAAAMRRAHERRDTLPPAAPETPVLPAWITKGMMQ